MRTIQLEKDTLEKSLSEENKKNEVVMNVLEQTESDRFKSLYVAKCF